MLKGKNLEPFQTQIGSFSSVTYYKVDQCANCLLASGDTVVLALTEEERAQLAL